MNFLFYRMRAERLGSQKVEIVFTRMTRIGQIFLGKPTQGGDYGEEDSSSSLRSEPE